MVAEGKPVRLKEVQLLLSRPFHPVSDKRREWSVRHRKNLHKSFADGVETCSARGRGRPRVNSRRMGPTSQEETAGHDDGTTMNTTIDEDTSAALHFQT
ncbi:UNVERIFIED_CONTAM: hypothetical protein PYX00_004081 [Menopon gallinae]|uniref:Uncharacterized protein n=1 Tax=Menopon gallinae TaxID=328185 RepID=A0AAW2I2U0_9NEOP